MDDKDKRGFSNLSDLASGIEVDDSVAEKVSDGKVDTITKATALNEEHVRETDVDKNINQSSPRKKSFFVKVIKTIGVTIGSIFIGSILIILGLHIYAKYQENKKEQEELAYHFDNNWQWHDKFEKIQISKVDESSYLRRVYPDKNYVIYAYKDEDYKLRSSVFFITNCNPGTKIITTKKFSDGVVKELECNDDGTSLYYAVVWNTNDTNVVWEEDLDGFSFREDFSLWDFKKLDQEITLSKAKK